MDEIMEVVKDIYPPLTIIGVDESLDKNDLKIMDDRGLASSAWSPICIVDHYRILSMENICKVC